MLLNHFQKFTLLLAILAAIFQSCKEEILLPDLNGNLVGYVQTYDEFSIPLDDLSDVLVSAHGIDGIFQTRTDLKGRFEFKNLAAGTYELQMEKEDFGTIHVTGVQHLGGEPTILGYSSGFLFTFGIYQQPATQILTLAIENDKLAGTFDFPAETPPRLNLIIYFSSEPHFIRNEAQKIMCKQLYNQNGTFRTFYSLNSGFVSGATIYFRASVLAGELYSNLVMVDADTYVEYQRNRIVYPILGNESAEFSYIVP